MLGDLWTYGEAVISNWLTGYWFLTAIPEALSYILPTASTQRAVARFDQWVSPERRQQSYRALFIVGVFLSGFVAWNDQYQIAIIKSPEAVAQRLLALEAYRQEHEVHEWLTIKADKVPVVLAALAATGPHSLSIACNDDDCEKLADQVDMTAKTAHWSSHVVSGTIAGIGNGLALYGPGKLRPTTDQIGKVFQDAIGSPVVTGSTGGVVSDEFLFTIGRKPNSQDTQ